MDVISNIVSLKERKIADFKKRFIRQLILLLIMYEKILLGTIIDEASKNDEQLLIDIIDLTKDFAEMLVEVNKRSQ